MEDGKTFVCKKCSKVFKQSSGLSRHKKGCSSDGTSKLYKCNTCLKTFTRDDSLMKHIKGRLKDSHATYVRRSLNCLGF